MTIDELSQLTPEQKRVKIAEACGWKQEEVEDGQTFSYPKRTAYRKMWLRNGDPTTKTIKLPDYPSSLDAMHEAVMSQPESFRKAMRFRLYEMCGQMAAHDATAAQRADAFLLTLP